MVCSFDASVADFYQGYTWNTHPLDSYERYYLLYWIIDSFDEVGQIMGDNDATFIFADDVHNYYMTTLY